ncbi:MAG: hypothetical protein PW999_35080 [Paraburkholderia tropica]|nr:hypothetical protein [Paraburkholderia tropica]
MNHHRTLLARAALVAFAIVAANPARSAETDTATDGTTNNAATASPANSNTLDVEVNAKRLDEARNGLLPETGSSIYRITQSDIQSMPQWC